MSSPSGAEVVVVTGASGGVGRAIAHAFGKRGAHVALLARGDKGLEDCRREVEALGGRALPIPTDVADADAIEAAAQRAEAELGEIDIWVNDAMATVFAKFVDVTPEEFKRATEVTYLGTVYGTMSALKRMTARNRGTIVQVGSALSYRGIPLQAAYCGAKFGIRGFTDSIRTELRHDRSKVHITMVQLPGVNTTQFNWCRSKLPKHPQPVPPIYQPEIPAEAVYWAAHHRRRELWVGYSTVQAIVGTKLSGLAGDIYLARTGFSGQQVQDMPVSPDRPSNLYEPVPDKAATHGIFDDQAKTRSPQLWAAEHRYLTAGAVLAAAGLGAGLGMRRR
ncbi:MAG TPA: SDR family oxidoreductase [Solirubrobacteraceae bacterium]|nr:SDR family oxidoreductase [Solirubrobacteraceae bacterium]